jgi:Uma2 family endonuclease
MGATKRREYAARGIPEYWLIDPESALVQICTLVAGEYQSTEFRGPEPVVSPAIPSLGLTAAQILIAGR